MNNWKRVFGIIWSGQLFSTLSSAIVGYAVVFWLSIKTESAIVLANATIAALLPQLVLGLFTGVYIDRWDRKQTMIFADIFIAICTLVMCIMFFSGEVKNGFIYALLALRSVGSAFHIPAMQASVPLLAPESELMRISGINQVIQSISTIAGPALAALLISTMNMGYVMLFDVIGAAIAVFTLLLVRIPNPKKSNPEQKPHMFREIKEGFFEIKKDAGLVWLFIFMIWVLFFIMPVSALFPLMTLDHFSGDTYKMSLVEIAWGIGTLLGGLFLGIQKVKVNNIILINFCYVIVGATFLFSGVLPVTAFIIFVVLTLIGGIFGTIHYSAFNVVLQKKIEPSVLGRVFSIFGSITMLPSMIGLLATGFIADQIGLTNAFVISGIAIIIAGIVSFLIPAVRKMIINERISNIIKN